jgi:hypothetical protein
MIEAMKAREYGRRIKYQTSLENKHFCNRWLMISGAWKQRARWRMVKSRLASRPMVHRGSLRVSQKAKACSYIRRLNIFMFGYGKFASSKYKDIISG